MKHVASIVALIAITGCSSAGSEYKHAVDCQGALVAAASLGPASDVGEQLSDQSAALGRWVERAALAAGKSPEQTHTDEEAAVTKYVRPMDAATEAERGELEKGTIDKAKACLADLAKQPK
jgi:hypothetical protein